MVFRFLGLLQARTPLGWTLLNYHLLPDELSDGLDLNISAVADLLRAVRNDAGHPTGRRLDRGDCFVHLQMFLRYMQKLYGLQAHLRSQGHLPGQEEQES